MPYRYTRRQTLAGGERYITAELKELEDTILSASDKCSKLEYQLFLQIREKLAGIGLTDFIKTKHRQGYTI